VSRTRGKENTKKQTAGRCGMESETSLPAFVYNQAKQLLRIALTGCFFVSPWDFWEFFSKTACEFGRKERQASFLISESFRKIWHVRRETPHSAHSIHQLPIFDDPIRIIHECLFVIRASQNFDCTSVFWTEVMQSLTEHLLFYFSGKYGIIRVSGSNFRRDIRRATLIRTAWYPGANECATWAHSGPAFIKTLTDTLSSFVMPQ
jgi:hypothetical protein